MSWRWMWSACSAARRSLAGIPPRQRDGKSSGSSTSNGATGRMPRVYKIASACTGQGGGRAVSAVPPTAPDAGQHLIDQHALQQALLAADNGLHEVMQAA